MIRALCRVLVFLILLAAALPTARDPGGTYNWVWGFAKGWFGQPPTGDMYCRMHPAEYRGWRVGSAVFETWVCHYTDLIGQDKNETAHSTCAPRPR